MHRIEWFLDRDTVVGSILCDEPKGASCRLYCPEGCETWPCGHELADSGKCNAEEWVDAGGGPAEYFAGKERVPLRDGPVDVSWDGDTWLWEYPLSGRSDG